MYIDLWSSPISPICPAILEEWWCNSIDSDLLMKLDYIKIKTDYYITSSLSLGFVEKPSNRLTQIFSQHNLPKPVYILEYFGNKTGVKKTLNNVAGVYICINLVNGKMYVGSAAFNRMFRRYRGHLYLASGGSNIVNKAVLKYGLINFAFIVIETVSAEHNQDKKAILNIEQKYLDQLNPDYNIVKVAGSVLNLKWSLESRKNLSLSILNNKERLDKIRKLHSGKILSKETRKLIQKAALNRIFSEETRKKMSMNNAKSVNITAYLNGSLFIQKKFTSIADAAEYFFQDRNKRSKIRTALEKNKLLLNKYELKRDSK
jgi:group I intron endonuclease